MYIIKNAFKCISRAKGRNILIGIIAPVICGFCLHRPVHSTGGGQRKEREIIKKSESLDSDFFVS